MELKMTNKTADPQQIMFCDGSAITVGPGEKEVIDLGSVYTEEIKRIERFFDIEEVQVFQKRNFKAVENEGGNE